MKKPKIMVVDDSPFSQRVIKDILTNAGYEVCACCDSGSSGIEQYKHHNPDIITMDLTLPDMNGLECCSQIKRLDQHTQFVIISAMKDEQIIHRGQLLDINDFLQKPIEQKPLLDAIQSIINRSNHQVTGKHDKVIDIFSDVVVNNLAKIAGLQSSLPRHFDIDSEYISHGMTLIVGITGTYRGRIILDMSSNLATYIAKKMLGNNPEDEAILTSISEFANIIAGHCVSHLNDLYKDQNIELRLSPPSILLGDALQIINLKLHTTTIEATTDAGSLFLNFGFLGGNELGCQTN